ncbi:MAG: hypothetical protein LBE05_05800 [Microbacterium sp.]|jgi:hypothetical protein|nr:hypothetical protein [Microbacterium sp.]
MTIVILDTNALPHGHYNERFFQQILDVAGHGAILVVPEVVIWEWAEHAHSALRTLAEQLKHHRVDQLLAPRLSVPDVPSVEELVESIESAIQWRAKIWSPPPGEWRSAVRQQVLQTGNGERKQEVKTGAADAIVLSCVGAQLEVAEGAVVLLSSDNKLRSEVLKQFSEARVASGSGELLAQFWTFTPAPDQLAVRTAERLTDFLNERISRFGEAMPFDAFGFEYVSGPIRLDQTSMPRLSSTQLRHVDIVEIYEFETSVDGDHRYGRAELRIFGDIALTLLLDSYEPDGEVRTVPSSFRASMAHIDVVVITEWNQNWELVSIEPAGVAVVVDMHPDDENDDGAITFRASEA